MLSGGKHVAYCPAIETAVSYTDGGSLLLVDSLCSSKGFIQTVRSIGKKAMHVICGVRKDKRHYSYKDQLMIAQKKAIDFIKSDLYCVLYIIDVRL